MHITVSVYRKGAQMRRFVTRLHSTAKTFAEYDVQTNAMVGASIGTAIGFGVGVHQYRNRSPTEIMSSPVDYLYIPFSGMMFGGLMGTTFPVSIVVAFMTGSFIAACNIADLPDNKYYRTAKQ